MPSDADVEIGRRAAAGSTSDDDRFPRAALELVGAVAAAEGRAAGRAEERQLSFAETAGVEQAHRQIADAAIAENAALRLKLASLIYSGLLDAATIREVRGHLGSYETRVASERDEALADLSKAQDALAELGAAYNEKLRANEELSVKLGAILASGAADSDALLVMVADHQSALQQTANRATTALNRALAMLDICRRYAEMEGADGDCAELANDHGGTKAEEDPVCRAVEGLRDRHAALLAKHAALRDAVRASLPTPLGPGLEYVQAALAASDLPELDDKARCLFASILLEAVYQSLMRAGDKRRAARCDGARAIAAELLQPGSPA